jgi:hypothetical protein
VQPNAFFPSLDIGTDPAKIRDWAQAAEDLGYAYIEVPDHVFGAKSRDGWVPLYNEKDPFHETFVTLGFLAAVTKTIGLSTGILIAPQRLRCRMRARWRRGQTQPNDSHDHRRRRAVRLHADLALSHADIGDRRLLWGDKAGLPMRRKTSDDECRPFGSAFDDSTAFVASSAQHFDDNLPSRQRCST